MSLRFFLSLFVYLFNGASQASLSVVERSLYKPSLNFKYHLFFPGGDLNSSEKMGKTERVKGDRN